MSTADTGKPVREGSPVKRKAILTAARDLFVRNGVDRVSMDAVAAQARVSKATVYDYFGDKRRLVQAILDDASESLRISLGTALAQHLGDDVGITTVAGLEKALTALAVELGTIMLGTPDYSAAFALVTQQRWQAAATGDVSLEALRQAFAERIAHYAEAGLLQTDDPRLASSQFVALTILLAADDQPGPGPLDPDQVRRTMIDGTHTFIRAFGSTPTAK